VTRHVTIAIGERVGERARARVPWVLESLMAPLQCTWSFADRDADIGYGTIGKQLTLEHVAERWQHTRTEPTSAASRGDDDHLARAYWWLARVEELDPTDDDLDEHGRFRADRSALAGMPAFAAPVDDIVALVTDATGTRLRCWNGDAPFALALSHDIDVPWRWTTSGRRRAARAVRDELRAGHPATAARNLCALAASPLWRLRRSDPWNNCAHIARREAALGARSSFFYIMGHHDPADGDAASYGRVRASAIAEAVAGGGEVGLHASYTTATDHARFRDELDQLRAFPDVGPVTTNRFHYLHHYPTRDWPDLVEMGIATDTSLAHAAMPGYRSGFSHPYRAWSHADEAPLDLVLVPMALMDATVAEARYLHLSPARAWRLATEMLDRAAVTHGAPSVLWHNDKLARSGGPWRAMYWRLLRDARARGAWLAPVGDIAAEWRTRIGPAGQ
jgi:hypothetical protein